MRNPPPYGSKRFQIDSARLVSWAGKIYNLGKASMLGLCFPYPCAGCGELQKYPDVLCSVCAGSLPRIHSPQCSICGSPLQMEWMVKICPECRERRPRITKIRSAFLYEGLIMKLIHEVKFSKRARSLRFFAEELYCRTIIDLPRRIGAIVPVPLHPSREWERTFNQAALLANELGTLSGVPVRNVLRRQKRTPPQTSLSGQARRRNLLGVFAAASVSVPSNVILVDDVVTTGATLEACAAALRKSGVRRVYGLTIARAVLKF